MNQKNEDRQLSVFEIDANDDETDVVFLEQAYAYHQQLVVEENRLPLTRNLINRDREGAEERLMADYFNDHCSRWNLFGQNDLAMFKNHREQVQGSSKHELAVVAKEPSSTPAPAPAPVKAVELSCVTCGGAHSHQNCPATHGNVYRDNISEYVSQAAAANYNQVSSNFRPQMVANHIRPPGFPPVQNSQANNANNFNRGNNFNQNRESNFNQNRGGNFNQSNFSQNQLHRPQVNQSPAYQAPVPQTHSVTKNDFDNYVKANDAIMRNMQNNLQNQASTSGQGTLPVSLFLTLRRLKGYPLPEAVLHIKDLQFPYFSVVKPIPEVTKDHVHPSCYKVPHPSTPQCSWFLLISIASGNSTPYYDPIVATSSPTLTPFGDSDFLLLEEVDSFLGLADDPDSILVDEPTEVDTQGTASHLEYAFLVGATTSCPFIMIKSWMLRKNRYRKGAKVPQASSRWKLLTILGTFQRCMLAIFHDMVEKTMEVFMDDFSVFGNSFQNCLSRDRPHAFSGVKTPNLCLNGRRAIFNGRRGIVLGHKISNERD
ncbi:hypothetical protein Tco_1320280 [Tanacetum coccineum]